MLRRDPLYRRASQPIAQPTELEESCSVDLPGMVTCDRLAGGAQFQLGKLSICSCSTGAHIWCHRPPRPIPRNLVCVRPYCAGLKASVWSLVEQERKEGRRFELQSMFQLPSTFEVAPAPRRLTFRVRRGEDSNPKPCGSIGFQDRARQPSGSPLQEPGRRRRSRPSGLVRPPACFQHVLAPGKFSFHEAR